MCLPVALPTKPYLASKPGRILGAKGMGDVILGSWLPSSLCKGSLSAVLEKNLYPLRQKFNQENKWLLEWSVLWAKYNL